jgi:hypothetical protein
MLEHLLTLITFGMEYLPEDICEGAYEPSCCTTLMARYAAY